MPRKTIWPILVCLLLLAGCHSPSAVSQTLTLAPGDSLPSGPGNSSHTYKLVRISPDGKAIFHNTALDMPISDSPAVAAVQKSLLNPGNAGQDFPIGVGQSFGLETESRRHHTTHTYRIQSTDPSKQQATVIVRAEED